MTAICILFSIIVVYQTFGLWAFCTTLFWSPVEENSGPMRFSDVEENSGAKASRMSCPVVYANIRGLHKNLSELSIIAKDEIIFFCFVLTLLTHSGTTFLSSWLQVLVSQCSCSGVRLNTLSVSYYTVNSF